MAIELPQISDEAVRTLVADIDKTGFGTLTNYIAPDDLRSMQAFVASAVATSGGEYVGFTGRQPVEGTALEQIALSPTFADLVRRVYECGTGRPAPEVEFYQVLRCLTGRTGAKHSMRFHYDSYVVTVLIPVEIPAVTAPGEPAGDLIMLPNTRRIRRSYAGNVFDKLLLDNRLSQFLLKRLAAAGLLRLARIKPVPGNIYFFWGYRSIHTNEPCAPHKVRATALYHYANPHAASKLSSAVRRPAVGKQAFG